MTSDVVKLVRLLLCLPLFFLALVLFLVSAWISGEDYNITWRHTTWEKKRPGEKP